MEVVNKKTAKDYRELAEGAPYQLIEGSLVEEPAPDDYHQGVSSEIHYQIKHWLKEEKLGEIRYAPYDVYLDDENVVQPDLLFVVEENRNKIHRDGLHGAPDLVIEILSKSNSYYDTHVKFHLYERHGVKEYFIINPEDKEVITYRLQANKFREESRDYGTCHSQLLNLTLRF